MEELQFNRLKIAIEIPDTDFVDASSIFQMVHCIHRYDANRVVKYLLKCAVIVLRM